METVLTLTVDDLAAMNQALASAAAEHFNRNNNKGTETFDQLESFVTVCGRAMTEVLMQRKSNQRLGQLGGQGEAACPRCKRLAVKRKAPEERRLQTLHGSVKMIRECDDCPRCRAAFSPC